MFHYLEWPILQKTRQISQIRKPNFGILGMSLPFVTFYNAVLRPLFLPRFSWWCLTSHLSSSCFPFLDAEFHEDLLLFGLGFEEIGICRSSKWANSCFFGPPSGKIVTGIYRGLSLSSRVGIKNNNHQQMITNVSGKHCRTMLHWASSLVPRRLHTEVAREKK